MQLVLFWALAAAGSPDPAVRAQAALTEACGACHDRARQGDEGGFDFLFDREALIAAKLISVGNPKASVLLQRVERSEMPPPEALIRLTAPQRRQQRDQLAAALKAWISAGAVAVGFDVPAPADPWRFIQREALESAAARDLEHFEPAARRWQRYFSLLELHNARGEVATARIALAKALNGASWRPTLVQPAAVDDDGLLLRVDLRELGWPVERWETVLLGAYPWGVSSPGYAAQALREETRSRLPVVRADWFLAEATRPPLYHALLALPSTQAGLESLLHVDAARDLRQNSVARAGFNGSGISQNNRVIERHSSRLGGYWKSYDFSGSAGAQNIFAMPLGPARDTGETRAFDHAGGELIFPLPNGLLGFLLTDATGRRLDKAPSAIVRDARRPDGAVENGLSCVGCHARGLIPKEDQLRAAVLEDPRGFSARELERVKALYPPSEGFAATLEADNRPTLAALKKLGVELDRPEPITACAARYEAELDLKTAAAELGLTASELLASMARLGSRAQALAPLRIAHGRVKRDAFLAVFPDLVSRLGGTPMRRAEQPRQSAATRCGTEPGSIDERIEDCAFAFADVRSWDGQPQAHRSSDHGDWSLVLSDGARVVWRDNLSGALWATSGASVDQRSALELCLGRASTELFEAPWTLPMARELIAAGGRGLPLGQREVWSQDVDNSDKYRSEGVTVSAQRARVVRQAEAAGVFCLVRRSAR